MRVLVTGATGLLGRAVVKRVAAAGHEVRSLVHATAVDRHSEVGQTEIIWGDVTNESELGRYVQGCDAVVHCAWQFARDGDPELYDKINVVPAVLLLRAAHEAGARTFILISSVSVYGLAPGADGSLFDEDSAFCSHEEAMDVYPRTKQKCEIEVTKVAREMGMNVKIIRPGLLYSDDVAPVKKMIKGKIALFAGMGRNHLPYVHVDSVADLIVRAMEDPAQSGAEVFNAVPETQATAKDVFADWKRQHKSGAIPVYLPSPLFKLLAIAPFFIKKLLKRTAVRPNVAYQTMTGTRNVTYSAQRALARYGWKGY
jgi:nucleoside-diphosphate-sugar epimerase